MHAPFYDNKIYACFVQGYTYLYFYSQYHTLMY